MAFQADGLSLERTDEVLVVAWISLRLYLLFGATGSVPVRAEAADGLIRPRDRNCKHGGRADGPLRVLLGTAARHRESSTGSRIQCLAALSLRDGHPRQVPRRHVQLGSESFCVFDGLI